MSCMSCLVELTCLMDAIEHHKGAGTLEIAGLIVPAVVSSPVSGGVCSCLLPNILERVEH